MSGILKGYETDEEIFDRERGAQEFSADSKMRKTRETRWRLLPLRTRQYKLTKREIWEAWESCEKL